ncbi:MAG: hypothetical protein GXO39_04790 [Thermotogae bacterium]|nr:hypothetical protein [Thermotogota bacterium]
MGALEELKKLRQESLFIPASRLARLLGVYRETVHRYARRGIFRAYRLSGTRGRGLVLVDIDSVIKALEEGVTCVTADGEEET